MNRALIVVMVALACSSREERTRQAAEFRLSRDSLLSAEVVKSLQPPATTGRLIYEPAADLSYDSLRVKRPELLSARDRAVRR